MSVNQWKEKALGAVKRPSGSRRLPGQSLSSASREHLVQEKDIRNAASWKEKLERILSLDCGRRWKPFMEVLGESFAIWSSLGPLREEHDAADVVLSAFYQQGKIKDYLDKLQAFAERIPQMSSAEAARNQGYYNYLFFIRQFLEDMERKYAAERGQLSEGQTHQLQAGEEEWQAARPNVEAVLAFIRQECASVAAVRDLPKVREALRRLDGSLVRGRIKTPDMRRDIATVSKSMELLELAMVTEDTSELQAVRDRLLERKAAMEENIGKAKKLYGVLTSTLTPEWFDAFDPESRICQVRDMDQAELKNVYEAELTKLREALSAVSKM